MLVLAPPAWPGHPVDLFIVKILWIYCYIAVGFGAPELLENQLKKCKH